MAPDVPIGSQSVRITLARHYGADDAHAGCAGDIRDHMMDLQIHLSECFLHMLDVGGCVVQRSPNKWSGSTGQVSRTRRRKISARSANNLELLGGQAQWLRDLSRCRLSPEGRQMPLL